MSFSVNIELRIPREVTIQPVYDQSAELTEVVAQWMEVVSSVSLLSRWLLPRNS